MSKLELFEQMQPFHGVLMPHGTETEEVQLLQDTEIALYVSPEEIDAIIATKETEFDDTASSLLKSKLQKDIIQAIAVPLGLGNVTAVYDRQGGSVDTIHNVREGVMTDAAKDKIESEVPYDSDLYHNHENYIQTNRENKEAKLNGTLVDGYSGETFKMNDRVDNEHIVSAKVLHDDAGRILSDVNGSDLANRDENLTPASASANRSKGKKSAEEFKEHLASTQEKRTEKIEKLTNKKSISDKERKELAKLEKLDAVDPELLGEADKQAREAIEKEINDKYYNSPKFAKNTASAAASEGGRMALQQLMGSVLVELFSGIITEIKDAHKNGRCQDSILADIKVRCKRIAANVATKWKEHAVAFGEGFLAGVLSSIVTTIINTFVTSAKRLARLLREGFNSVLRAFKTIILRPEGTTMADAKHEALKLIFVGGVLCGTILLEDAIEKAISSVIVLAPIATILSMAITGAITALVIILISLMIDKLDLFGAMEAKKSNFVSKSLTKDLNQELDKFEEITKDRTSLIDMS